MPTLLRKDGFIFEMVMFDCRERRHVHVKGNAKGGAKFWLEPFEQASASRYNDHELSTIRKIIRDNLATLIQRWDEECARAAALRTG